MKRWVSAILMLLLLVEMLPVTALAVVVSGKPLTENELNAFRVLAGVNEGAAIYHNGMGVSGSMNAEQLSGWLDEQLSGTLYSVSHVVARAQTALYDLKNESPEDYQKLISNSGGAKKVDQLKALMVEAEDLRQTLLCANDTVDESQAIIQAMTDLMSSDQTYDYEKVRYSERIRQAGGNIQQVRKQVVENHEAWLRQIEDMQSTVDDTWSNSALGAWMDALFSSKFDPVVAEAPLMVSSNVNSRASRLGANGSVLSNDTTSVTVLGKDTIGIVLYDKDGKHAPDGIVVSIRDADGDEKAPLVSDTTGSQEKGGGWVAFNIHNFQADEDGYVDVYMEIDASQVKGDSGLDRFQSFCVPKQKILHGTKFNVTLKDNDGSPYIYKTSFNNYDFLYTERKFYYSDANDLSFDIVLETRNLKQDDPRAPVLVYTDADGKSKTATATRHDGNTYIYTNTWKKILSPAFPDVYIRFGGAASNADGAQSGDIKTMLKPIPSVFNQPTDLSQFMKGASRGFGFSFNIPGINRNASLDLTPDFLKNWMPKVNVDISGTVAVGLGYLPKEFNPDPAWMSKEMEDYDKEYKDIQKRTNMSNWKQNSGSLRDYYKYNKINWLAKGGINAGVFAMLSAKWNPEEEDDVVYLKINGVGGITASFYIDITYQTAIGPVPVYANLNINFSLGMALGLNLDYLLDKQDHHIIDWSIHPDDFTIDFRLTISVTMGAGIKGIASLWVKGAGYIDVAVQIFLASSKQKTLKITGGASVSAGLTLLFLSFSIDLWKGGPWLLYTNSKESTAYSLLDHYMPGQTSKNEDKKTELVPMGPESYPDLAPAATAVLTKMDDTLDAIKIVTLGDDLYTFYIQGGRLRWRNVTKNVTGSITDAIDKGRQLYPAVYDSGYVAGNVKEYDFDVITTTGEVVGDSDYKPGTFITVAALCAGSFDDNGYPLEVENNVCLYTLHLWRASDGSLSCAMNANEAMPGYFRSAWIGGQGGLVDFIGAQPIIELVNSRVTVGSDNSYSYENAVDVELSRIQKVFTQREQIVASVGFKQAGTTTASGGKPDLGSLNVTNGQTASDDDEIASGAGDDYVRVFHRMGPDDSWLAVSRSEDGKGDKGAIEFYDNAMDAAGEDDMVSIVLDEANTESFAQALIPMDGGNYARVIFYTDDVGTDGRRCRLKSLYLEPTDHKDGEGNLEIKVSATSYDIDMPTDNFKQQTIGGAINLYWLTSVVLKDDKGNNYDAYRVMFAVYDQGSNTLSNASVCAEFTLPESDLAIRDLFLTPTGKGYLTASQVPKSIGEQATDEKTPLSLYAFQTTFKPVLDIKGLVFEETLVSPSEFDDYTVSMMNSGNLGVTSFDMEMVLHEDGVETVVGTLHADCLYPENSWMKMGDTQVSSGDKAFKRLFDFDLTPQRRDWVVGEKNKKYVVEGGKLKSADETKEQFDYVTTDVILPGALAAFKSTMQIPSSWDGRKDLEVRVAKMVSNTNWVSAMALAANRSTISAAPNGLKANNSTGTELTYVRDAQTGQMVLQSEAPVANAMVEAGLLANAVRMPESVKIQSMHDLHVSHRVYMGPQDEKWLSISFFDYAETGEALKLYAEMYIDGAKEPVRLALPYYENAVSDGKTHTYDMPLASLVDPNSCQTARVVIRAVGIPDRGLADNEFTLYLDGEASPLMIISQPRDVTAKVGDTVSFSVGVSGGAKPYHYQWQVWMGEEKGWVDLKDAVLPTLVVDDVTLAMSGRKARCIITDASGQRIVSDAAILTVIDPHPVDTGDHSNLPLYLAVALAALALLCLLRRRLRAE